MNSESKLFLDKLKGIDDCDTKKVLLKAHWNKVWDQIAAGKLTANDWMSEYDFCFQFIIAEVMDVPEKRDNHKIVYNVVKEIIEEHAETTPLELAVQWEIVSTSFIRISSYVSRFYIPNMKLPTFKDIMMQCKAKYYSPAN